MSKRYGIRSATIAIHSFHGQSIVVRVPVDSVITLAEELGNRDGLIDVVWDGKHYQMFNQDLRERCEPLD